MLNHRRCSVLLDYFSFFFFKQKTAYEMRISDWSSDVCSSDLIELEHRIVRGRRFEGRARRALDHHPCFGGTHDRRIVRELACELVGQSLEPRPGEDDLRLRVIDDERPSGGREAPADRRHHDARACGAIEKSEIELAVLE